MKMRCCDSCKFMGDREWFDIPPMGDIPAIPVRQGRCYAVPPDALSRIESTFRPIALHMRCGFHSFGWRGFWRAVRRIFTRET